MRARSGSKLALGLAALLAAALSARGAAAQDVEPNDSPGTASPVALALGGSRSIEGTLSPGGSDFDYYAITLTSRQILVATTKPEGGNFDFPDTQIRVLDTDGSTELVENDDAGSDYPLLGGFLGSTLRFRAPADGTYYLVVTGCCDQANHGESGGYELILGLTIETATATVDTDPTNDTAAGADDLGIVGSGTVLQVATLEPRAEGAGDVDLYRVALRSGDTLVATTIPFEGVLDHPDTVIGIFDGSSWLGTDDDAGSDFPKGSEHGSTIRFRAFAQGTYYLAISGFPDDKVDGALDGEHEQSGDYAFVASVASSVRAPEIPTLSQGGLALLGLAIAGVGWIAAGRRA